MQTTRTATPSYWKTNEQVAMILLTKGIRNDVQARVLASIEARIATQATLGYQPSK